MNAEVKANVVDAVSDVLAEFALATAEYRQERDPGERRGDGRYLHAVITFAGKQHGSLSMTAPRDLCQRLAANVLGLEPGDVVAGTDADVIKELVNIMCGVITARLFGLREAFALTVPAFYRIDRQKWLELDTDKGSLRFVVGNLPLLINVLIVGQNGNGSEPCPAEEGKKSWSVPAPCSDTDDMISREAAVQCREPGLSGRASQETG